MKTDDLSLKNLKFYFELRKINRGLLFENSPKRAGRTILSKVVIY